MSQLSGLKTNCIIIRTKAKVTIIMTQNKGHNYQVVRSMACLHLVSQWQTGKATPMRLTAVREFGAFRQSWALN